MSTGAGWPPVTPTGYGHRAPRRRPAERSVRAGALGQGLHRIDDVMAPMAARGAGPGVSANLMNTDSRFEFTYLTPVLRTMISLMVTSDLAHLTRHCVI